MEYDERCLYCIAGREHGKAEHERDINRTQIARDHHKTPFRMATELLNPSYARRLYGVDSSD